MATNRNSTQEAGKKGVGVRTVVGVGAIAIFVLFLLQNLQHVDVNFLWFSASMGLIWALLLAAVLGGFATLALGYFARRRDERKASR